MYRIGIDLGGTNIAAGIVDEKYNIIERASVPTEMPAGSEEIVQKIVTLCKNICDKAGVSIADIAGIGIGAPGAVNPDTGEVIFACNINMHNTNLAQLISERTGISCKVENDANAAAYGEYIAGAGRGSRDFVLLTIGTGIGGGIIIGGKLFSGSNYAGGEIGHMVTHVGGEKCSCGRSGCFERYASASALVRKAGLTICDKKDSLIMQLCGGDVSKINAKTVCDAADAGDTDAQELLADFARELAAGLTNIVNIFQPEIICIGGGMSAQGEKLLSPVREILYKENYARDIDSQVKLTAAELGNDAGIIGAAYIGA
ncbi:MAG: ROK family protein [Lachnospiraceae bacterium]|nr:ROK family protein [Candidatus Minthocola equi]